MPKTAYTDADHLFRELLKETRLARNLSQADVARGLGVPQSYVSKYESGERRLDFVETVHVCDVLGIAIKEFAAAYSSKLRKAETTKNG